MRHLGRLREGAEGLRIGLGDAAEGDERGKLAQTVTRLFLRGGGRNPGNDKR